MVGRVIRRGVIALSVASLMVVACTSAPSSTAAQTGSSSGSPGQPHDYDVLKVVMNNAGTGTLDVVKAQHTKASQYAQMWSDFLVRVDPSTLQPVPDLATSWTVNTDATEYTFKLRHDVTFQDGTPFNAGAVKSNFDRISAAKASQSYTALGGKSYAGTTVVDPYTVKVSFSKPDPDFLDQAGYRLWFDSPTAVQKYGKQYGITTVVGTGPYKVVEWVPNDHIYFERWDGYKWGPSLFKIHGKGYAKRIEIRGVVEGATRRAALESGQADIVMLDEGDVGAIKNDPRFKVELEPKAGTVRQLDLIQKSGPLADLAVRQAMAYAIDRQAIVKDPRYSGIAQVALGIQGAKNMGGAWPDSLKNVQYSYDPKKAEQLLDAAGYKSVGNVREKNGQKLSFDFSFPTGTLEEVQPLQAMFAAVGISVKLRELQVAAWFDAYQKGTTNMTIASSSGVGFDMFVPEFHTGGTENWWGVSDPTLDKMLDKIEQPGDAKARLAASADAQAYIIQHAYAIPIVDVYYPFGMKKSVNDVYFPTFSWPNFYQTWVGQ